VPSEVALHAPVVVVVVVVVGTVGTVGEEIVEVVEVVHHVQEDEVVHLGKKEKVVDVREEKERNAAAIISGTKMVFIGTKIVQNVSRIAGAK
jgi:hypothetical protein